MISVHAFAEQGEFSCPPSTRDSGYRPGIIIRWCEINRDGRLLYHGPVWRWHQNGQLESKENYVYGNADGETPSWYDNGRPSSLGRFANGNKQGLWKYWNKDGRLTTEVTYAASGNEWLAYFPSASKKYQGTATKRGKVGNWTLWDEQGRIKAQCDFGDGQFVLPKAKGCKAIADLSPAGFARPMAKAFVGTNKVLLSIASEKYEITVPDSWKADTDSAKDEDVLLTLYPTNGKWRGSGPNAYVRVVYREKGTFQDGVKRALDQIDESTAEFSLEKKVDSRVVNGRQWKIAALSYRQLLPTDSPFTIVTPNVAYERVHFLEASRTVVFMFVLTSADKKTTQDAAMTMERIVSSIVAVK